MQAPLTQPVSNLKQTGKGSAQALLFLMVLALTLFLSPWLGQAQEAAKPATDAEKPQVWVFLRPSQQYPHLFSLMMTYFYANPRFETHILGEESAKLLTPPESAEDSERMLDVWDRPLTTLKDNGSVTAMETYLKALYRIYAAPTGVQMGRGSTSVDSALLDEMTNYKVYTDSGNRAARAMQVKDYPSIVLIQDKKVFRYRVPEGLPRFFERVQLEETATR